ncbi:hydroxymethylglutaryl-CoA lyase [uncultured Sphingomonas sp.]|uniref:hydroxymethylglutaryl-CoA lyase n=1 Tax=uncultured Sphingomonas sp. TaxID=158754 RepID=UPI0026386B9A|nr:hydroxymethylglutaryl-CoA lyase [uncultured Sphingomonas sp.]
MPAIEIVEVAPRDGLQNEARIVSTAHKLELIDRAIVAGARRLEVTSFVNPRRVPQMADADEVVAGLPDRDDVTFIALVLNRRGAERALATRIDELGAVCIASDTFGIRNQGQTSAESLDVARETVALARAAGRSAQITIATAFGCPFEGEVPLDRVVEMAKRAADASPREVALADTIGAAVPGQVSEAVARVAEAIAPLPVRVHFHDTRNTAVANVWAAINAGASVIDAALGGLGGCPFAPGASGNVATEDVLYLLDRSRIATGYDRALAIDVANWLTGVVGRDLSGKVRCAPAFPAVTA